MQQSKSIVSAVSISAVLVATAPLMLGASSSGCKKGAKSGGGAGSIALLLPESQTTRYESADKPFFEAKFKQLCPDVEIVYSNANQKTADQQTQAEAAI